MTKEEIMERITASPKYKGLYRKTIQRVVETSVGEEEARKKLHQIWGAYFGIRPNFRKLLTKMRKNDQETAFWMLQMQSSTKERVGEMESTYRQIYEVTQGARTIVDYGCGLNSLTHFWWPEEAGWKYTGIDIDLEELDFLRQMTGMNFTAGDILIDELPAADMYWLLKLLSVLERQKPGAALETLIKVPARWMVVSYPVKSISGRQKGMKETYQKQFEELVADQGWNVHVLNCKNELVFVVDKG